MVCQKVIPCYRRIDDDHGIQQGLSVRLVSIWNACQFMGGRCAMVWVDHKWAISYGFEMGAFFQV